MPFESNIFDAVKAAVRRETATVALVDRLTWKMKSHFSEWTSATTLDEFIVMVAAALTDFDSVTKTHLKKFSSVALESKARLKDLLEMYSAHWDKEVMSVFIAHVDIFNERLDGLKFLSTLSSAYKFMLIETHPDLKEFFKDS